MIGYILDRAHVAFQAITRPLRERRSNKTLIKCLAAVSDAKDALRRAKVRGDTRAQHYAYERLCKAQTDLLRAECKWRAAR
ncbi:MAG: hypothetical protein VX755_06835 [Pseudomonadota bacterium]|nr:hypothetical protein [Pseudomonadota bacterium]MED5538660.1 hypothetical protein [Pseudomonadota bacterium]